MQFSVDIVMCITNRCFCKEYLLLAILLYNNSCLFNYFSTVTTAEIAMYHGGLDRNVIIINTNVLKLM